MYFKTPYIQYSKLYKIPSSEVVVGKRRKKSMLFLRSQIKQYEKNNNIQNGLYF